MFEPVSEDASVMFCIAFPSSESAPGADFSMQPSETLDEYQYGSENGNCADAYASTLGLRNTDGLETT